MNSIEKTLGVVRALALPGAPHRLADLAAAAGLGKTSTHRILQVLVANNYAHARGDGEYAPGPALHALGVSVSQGLDLEALARPVLSELQKSTGHTVHFAVRSGRAAVYVAKIEGDRPYQMASRIGMQIRLHCTSIGKAVLSTMPRDDVRTLLTDPDDPAETIPAAELDALIAELDAISERGYSIDDEENEPNVRCVGAPVFNGTGQILGGVSVSGLTYTFSLDDLRAAAPSVMSAAAQLSVALGSGLQVAR